MPRVSVGESHEIGELRVFFQHVNGEPAMIIGSRHMNRRRAYVICLSAAWEYDNTEMLIVKSANAANVLGLGVSRDSTYKIADLILNYLPDLIKMAPKEDPDAQKIIEEAVEKYGLDIKVDHKSVF